MIQQGNADIVVGTRSAVFSPLHNLGLIIVDEEQEHTYQSESAPRYDAHDIAKKRAVMENALLVFASATPLTETYHAAQSGKLKLVTLTQRYGGCPLPSVDFIDMRAELTAGNPREVSRRLARELQENLDNGEQSILLLNRRGYRTIGMCTDCGHVLKCPNCSVPLVYHKPQQALMCHHCGQTVHPLPTLCPECGGKIHYSGFGTQRVEEELAELLCGWTRTLPAKKTPTKRCWPSLPGTSTTSCLAPRWWPRGWTLKKLHLSVCWASTRCCSGRASAPTRACSAWSRRSSAAAAALHCPAAR